MEIHFIPRLTPVNIMDRYNFWPKLQHKDFDPKHNGIISTKNPFVFMRVRSFRTLPLFFINLSSGQTTDKGYKRDELIFSDDEYKHFISILDRLNTQDEFSHVDGPDRLVYTPLKDGQLKIEHVGESGTKTLILTQAIIDILKTEYSSLEKFIVGYEPIKRPQRGSCTPLECDTMRIKNRHEVTKSWLSAMFKPRENKHMDGILTRKDTHKVRLTVRSKNGQNAHYIVEIRNFNYRGEEVYPESALVFTEYEYEMFVSLLPGAQVKAQAYERPDESSAFIIWPIKETYGIFVEHFVDGKTYTAAFSQREMKQFYFYFNNLRSFVEDYNKERIDLSYDEWDDVFFLPQIPMYPGLYKRRSVKQ